MTYVYRDQRGREHEAEQRITDPAYTHRDPKTGDWYTMTSDAHEISAQLSAGWRVTRLIAGAPRFNLKGGGWAADGYSK